MLRRGRELPRSRCSDSRRLVRFGSCCARARGKKKKGKEKKGRNNERFVKGRRLGKRHRKQEEGNNGCYFYVAQPSFFCLVVLAKIWEKERPELRGDLGLMSGLVDRLEKEHGRGCACPLLSLGPLEVRGPSSGDWAAKVGNAGGPGASVSRAAPTLEETQGPPWLALIYRTSIVRSKWHDVCRTQSTGRGLFNLVNPFGLSGS